MEAYHEAVAAAKASWYDQHKAKMMGELVIAIKNCQVDEVVQLLSRYNIVDKADEDGNTPLIHACRKGCVVIIRVILLGNGISNADWDKYGKEALLLAASRNSGVRHLLDNGYVNKHPYGLQLISKDYDGVGDHVEHLQFTANGININAENKEGWTALKLVAKNGNDKIVELLLSAKGIDVNKADKKHGDTALIWACRGGHVVTVEKLLEVEGIDVNKANKDGETPLMAACFEGHIDVARVLLAAEGIDVNKEDKRWKTALNKVTFFGANILLDMQYDAEEDGWHSEVARIDVVLRNHRVIEKMLRARGAYGVSDSD